jgi:hypothetical protein
MMKWICHQVTPPSAGRTSGCSDPPVDRANRSTVRRDTFTAARRDAQCGIVTPQLMSNDAGKKSIPDDNSGAELCC